jgi:hypothetical protein
MAFEKWQSTGSGHETSQPDEKRESIGPLHYTIQGEGEFAYFNFGYGFAIEFGNDDEDLRDVLGKEGMAKSDNGRSDLLTVPVTTKMEQHENEIHLKLPLTGRTLVIHTEKKDHFQNYIVTEKS